MSLILSNTRKWGPLFSVFVSTSTSAGSHCPNWECRIQDGSFKSPAVV